MKSTRRLIESICNQDYAGAKKNLAKSLKVLAAQKINEVVEGCSEKKRK